MLAYTAADSSQCVLAAVGAGVCIRRADPARGAVRSIRRGRCRAGAGHGSTRRQTRNAVGDQEENLLIRGTVSRAIQFIGAGLDGGGEIGAVVARSV